MARSSTITPAQRALLVPLLLTVRASAIALITALDQLLSMLGVQASTLGVHPSIQSMDNVVDRRVDKPMDALAPAVSSEISFASLPSEKKGDGEESPSNHRVQLVGHDGHDAGGRRVGQLTQAAIAGCWDGIGGMQTSGALRARCGDCADKITELARARNLEPLVFFKQVCDRFKADQNVKNKRLGLGVLLGQIEQWADDVPPSSPSGAAASAPSRPAYQLLPSGAADGSPAPAELLARRTRGTAGAS